VLAKLTDSKRSYLLVVHALLEEFVEVVLDLRSVTLRASACPRRGTRRRHQRRGSRPPPTHPRHRLPAPH
jgi:hypothetical protein